MTYRTVKQLICPNGMLVELGKSPTPSGETEPYFYMEICDTETKGDEESALVILDEDLVSSVVEMLASSLSDKMVVSVAATICGKIKDTGPSLESYLERHLTQMHHDTLVVCVNCGASTIKGETRSELECLKCYDKESGHDPFPMKEVK